MKYRIVEFEPDWFRAEKMVGSPGPWEPILASVSRTAMSVEEWVRKNHVPEDFKPHTVKEFDL